MANPLTPDVLVDPVELTRALVDIESVSRNEKRIADCVEEVLRQLPHLSVERFGHTLMARTELGRAQRVVLAGHLDTVPLNDNFPSTVVDDLIYGCGTSDMKSGVALALHLAATLPDPRFDLTYFFYEAEEIEGKYNGLKLVGDAHPEWLAADFAVLLEPTYGVVEAGCQGTLRVLVRTTGRRAHSARSWRGVNAIHAAGEALNRLQAYAPRTVTIDGCTYREGLNAVRIAGGVAGNVIPDACELEVNFRFAPDRDEKGALEHVLEVFEGYEVELTDSAPGALPGLTAAPAREFLAAVGAEPAAKLGWTDVARFASLGIPAMNYGPGDPLLAHAPDEHVEIGRIRDGAATLHRWLAPEGTQD
ncbi:succinyl-diaminopimelate desuccinylase [Spirilliplanes yamanashiensis]|uniref:Succinyl-diaminopimelate desuccinylase n=1 Tax=Spirilliplanes yamanashiensis TaxID=42233 RepID=A0A8J3Y417_9ACTN|nr:succinyl-diaminopimelate desuccinylase [Spirilliplanes yamanashiensis]MDP9814037.1 succinyl-diaminopimelate desuccinylase [Spirilliplanes yamanashiensis]GIJ00983.1 succinyl-diaminopimelate desuccinylase [Spirilliplanes yamanashiensis]